MCPGSVLIYKLFEILACRLCGGSNKVYCNRGFVIIFYYDGDDHFRTCCWIPCIWWDRRSLNQWPNIFILLDVDMCLFCFVSKQDSCFETNSVLTIMLILLVSLLSNMILWLMKFPFIWSFLMIHILLLLI